MAKISEDELGDAAEWKLPLHQPYHNSSTVSVFIVLLFYGN